MQVGDKGKLTIDVTGVIENIRVLSDQTGDIVLIYPKHLLQIILILIV